MKIYCRSQSLFQSSYPALPKSFFFREFLCQKFLPTVKSLRASSWSFFDFCLRVPSQFPFQSFLYSSITSFCLEFFFSRAACLRFLSNVPFPHNLFLSNYFINFNFQGFQSFLPIVSSQNLTASYPVFLLMVLSRSLAQDIFP